MLKSGSNDGVTVGSAVAVSVGVLVFVGVRVGATQLVVVTVVTPD